MDCLKEKAVGTPIYNTRSLKSATAEDAQPSSGRKSNHTMQLE